MLGPLDEVLAKPEGQVSGENRELLTIMRRNGQRLLKLVNTLLDFSRIEAGRVQAVYEPLDLAAYTTELASVFRSAIQKTGIRLVIDCAPFSEPVFCGSRHVGKDCSQSYFQRLQIHPRGRNLCFAADQQRLCCIVRPGLWHGYTGSGTAESLQSFSSRRGSAGSNSRRQRHRSCARPGAGQATRRNRRSRKRSRNR